MSVNLRRATFSGMALATDTSAPKTVPLKEAARLLGTTPEELEALSKQGDVSLVLTPEGRQEMPSSHLADLLGAMQGGLSLAGVIESRRSQAAALPLEELLPPLGPKDAFGHRPAELRALVYHRVVVRRLDEETRSAALGRLKRWLADGRIHPEWARRWEEALTLPLSGLAALIAADTPETRALHQSSPFAGVLTEQERRRVLDVVQAALARLS